MSLYLDPQPAWKKQRKQDPSFDPEEKVAVINKSSKKLTEKQIYDLIKSEQVALINKLDSKANIPRLEADRVKLILDLQK